MILWAEGSVDALGSGQGLNRPVYHLTVHDGDLIAAGIFTDAGGTSVSSIARWDGSVWNTFSSVPSDVITAITSYSNALIVAAQSADSSRNHFVAAWDGIRWTTVGLQFDDQIHSLTVYDGDLIAAGRFERIGPDRIYNIARWNGQGWAPLGPGMNGSVFQIFAHDGWLYAGGIFRWAGDAFVSNVARWNGVEWSELGSGVEGRPGSYGGRVDAFAAFEGSLVVGGRFERAGEATAFNVARWDGEAWWPLGNGLSEAEQHNSSVAALLPFGGDLIATGGFLNPDGKTAGNLARWDGQTWSPLGSGIDDEGNALAVHEGRLFVGGRFRRAGEKPSHYIARWGQTPIPAAATPIIRIDWLRPNPVRDHAQILYTLGTSARVRISVHDLLGRRLALIKDAIQPTGTYVLATQNSDATALLIPSGVYLLRIEAGRDVVTRKFTVLR